MGSLKVSPEEWSPQFAADLEEKLYEFNAKATGITDGSGLAFSVKDERGAFVGAIAGTTWAGTCEINQLWVEQGFRGQGVGKRLMAAAENEARRRGCFQMVLSTHSFQAPGFYRKLGYVEIGRVPDYPRGHSSHTFQKPL